MQALFRFVDLNAGIVAVMIDQPALDFACAHVGHVVHRVDVLFAQVNGPCDHVVAPVKTALCCDGMDFNRSEFRVKRYDNTRQEQWEIG